MMDQEVLESHVEDLLERVDSLENRLEAVEARVEALLDQNRAQMDLLMYLIAVLDIGEVIEDDVTEGMLSRAYVKGSAAIKEVEKRRKKETKTGGLSA